MQRREQRKGSEVAEVKRALTNARRGKKKKEGREEGNGSDKGRRRECSAPPCEMISGGAKARGARE